MDALTDPQLVAARSLKVFALPVMAIAVACDRSGVAWLLHCCAARGDRSRAAGD
jgi:hypothetical protein